jgi:hypothetical protein
MGEQPYADLPGDDLYQGDLLRRSDALNAILESYHPRYFANRENEFFLVLTQSCDMVKGRSGDGCKAQYITICAVRPLQTAFENELKRHVSEPVPGIRYASYRARARIDQFLARLINNNEDGYFFLRADPGRGIPKDYCAFLRLAVPIKSSEHYDTCVKARIRQLDPAFQAKLGWLLGDLFSRVGTEDWDDETLKGMVNKISKTAAIWIDDKQIADLGTEIATWKTANVGQNLDAPVFKAMIKGLPSRKKKVMTRLRELIEQSDIVRAWEPPALRQERIKRLTDILENDSPLSLHLK